jgi:hypothetical protein
VGIAGKRSALARVTLVNYDGEVIYDQHVRPSEKITGLFVMANYGLAHTLSLLEDVLHGYNLHSPESLRAVQTSEPG